MTDWKALAHDWRTPPDMQERDVASLWARMGVLEDAVLRVVEDERRDPLFKILAALVALMATLQRRILRDERWNRRMRRKQYMLDGEAMRMNMCDRLGGVEALERWEARARGRLGGECKREGKGDRGGSGLARGGGTQEGGPASGRGNFGRGMGEDAVRRPVREFALPRLPSAGERRRRCGGVRSPARHETPIAVWPCEVMPERFRREWWKTPNPRREADNNLKPDGHSPNRDKFPENARGIYPGPPMSEGSGETTDVGGPAACTAPAAQRDASPGTCVCGRKRVPP